MNASITLAGKRILVVEDDYMVAMELVSRLEGMGFMPPKPAPTQQRVIEQGFQPDYTLLWRRFDTADLDTEHSRVSLPVFTTASFSMAAAAIAKGSPSTGSLLDYAKLLKDHLNYHRQPSFGASPERIVRKTLKLLCP